jgi:hypothetical protein
MEFESNFSMCKILKYMGFRNEIFRMILKSLVYTLHNCFLFLLFDGHAKTFHVHF